MSISLFDQSPRHKAATNDAFARMEQVQQLMSFHDRNSELSMLNQQAQHAPVTVSTDTWNVLCRAQYWSELSAGAFDCTIAPILINWGLLPTTLLPYTNFSYGNYQHIELLPKNNVRFRTPLMVDLGGIAKGYAVDQAANCLEQSGIYDYLINAGGDLRTGNNPQSLWIRHPANPGQLHSIPPCARSAVATSASYFSRKTIDNKMVHALVNPFTQQPADPHCSISVLCQNCMDADALTKIVAVLGSKSIALLQNAHATAYCLDLHGYFHQIIQESL